MTFYPPDESGLPANQRGKTPTGGCLRQQSRHLLQQSCILDAKGAEVTK